MENSVPKFWKWVFSIELPLVLGTVVYWVGFGDVFVSEIYGKKIEGIEYFLLQQYSVVIFSYLVWFYGRLIFSESLRITEFTYFQEAALIGDIYLVASAIYYQHLFKSPITMWLQAGMALFWGIIRIFFLFSVSLKLGVYNSKSLGDTKKTT